MECSFPDCEFSTPPAIPTYELLLKALELHVRTAHTTQQHGSQTPNLAKTEKPKRPSITLNMSESDWIFFEHRWTRYRRQSNIQGQQISDELWACMDHELERLAFQDGIRTENPDQLLIHIKNLAVTTVHTALHVVALHELKQTDTEKG